MDVTKELIALEEAREEANRMAERGESYPVGGFLIQRPVDFRKLARLVEAAEKWDECKCEACASNYGIELSESIAAAKRDGGEVSDYTRKQIEAALSEVVELKRSVVNVGRKWDDSWDGQGVVARLTIPNAEHCDVYICVFNDAGDFDYIAWASCGQQVMDYDQCKELDFEQWDKFIDIFVEAMK